jgi:hypothetical protein
MLASAAKAKQQASHQMSNKEFWNAAAPIITRALDYQDTHTITDIEEAIQKKRAQLWVGKKSVLVTQIDGFPRGGKKCRIWLAAGSMSELVDEMLPAVERWAKEEKCTAVIISGRKGWARVLAKKQYKQNYVSLERKI